jgi:hypothetical protein
MKSETEIMITPYKWKQNHEVRGLTTQCRIIKLQKYIKKTKKKLKSNNVNFQNSWSKSWDRVT